MLQSPVACQRPCLHSFQRRPVVTRLQYRAAASAQQQKNQQQTVRSSAKPGHLHLAHGLCMASTSAIWSLVTAGPGSAAVSLHQLPSASLLYELADIDARTAGTIARFLGERLLSYT